MARINFVFGQTLAFDSLAPNTIALDGTVQGPQIDATGRRFSFDHHAGCIRLVTLATCQQVATALTLGMVVDEETTILINDLDADTVLAVWLLLHPERVGEARVKELVERIGLTDAHGPICPPHAIHRELAPVYGSKEPQTLEMLGGFLAKVSAYADGTWQEPAARPERKSDGFGWSPARGWEVVTSTTGFEQVYKMGHLVAILYTEAPNGTVMYTLGKRSDLVPFDITGLLARLNAIEPGWGGSSTVGGSPHKPDGSRSSLSPEQVLEVAKN